MHNDAKDMANQQLQKIMSFLAPYQSALNLPALSKIIAGGGAGGAVLPMNTAVSQARNEAATAGLNEAEAATRAANQRMGPGASYSSLPGDPLAAFRDKIAQSEASTATQATGQQQQLQLQNFNSAISPLTSIINTLFGGYTTTGTAGINNANWNPLTGSGGIIPALAEGAKGAGALGASDRRLKSNIEVIGKFGPLRVYEYDIDGHRERGVMAQEAKTLYPEAVVERPDTGTLMVNYNRLKELVAHA